MYAPLSFFLQNPVGETLLAFTKDQDIIDENLVDSLHYLVSTWACDAAAPCTIWWSNV